MICHVTGDATVPQYCDGEKAIIAHIVNDVGVWGRGFVVSLSKRWPNPERCYRDWYAASKSPEQIDKYPPFQLGNVLFVPATPHIMVANMIAQHGIMRKGLTVPPIRYDALEECLYQVNQFATELGITVHMPKIGAGLAGGDWSKIEKIVDSIFTTVYVYVYTLEDK